MSWFDRQLHPDEQGWTKENARRFAQRQGISQQGAEQRLAQQGFRRVARPIVFPNPLQPNVPAVLQGFSNPMLGLAGATGGSIVQGTTSFVPSYENK